MATAAPLVSEDFEHTEHPETSDFSTFTPATEGASTDRAPSATNFDSDASWWDANSLPGAYPGRLSTQLISNNPAMPAFTSTSFSTTGGASFLTTGGETTGSASFSTRNSTHSMDTDLPSSSTNTNKRTYSTMSFGNNYRSITAPTLSDPRSMKRHQNSQGSYTGSKGSKTSVKLSTKLSPATAVVGMQGSINRLTDVLKKSMVPPPPSFEELLSGRRMDAMQRLQATDDDHLSLTQQVGMVSLFNKDIKIVDTYLSLSNDNLRRCWMLTILEENNIGEEV